MTYRARKRTGAAQVHAYRPSSRQKINSRKLKRQIGILNLQRVLPKYIIYGAAVIFLIVLSVYLINRISGGMKKNIAVENVSAFRLPSKSLSVLMTLSDKYEKDLSDILTLYALENNFFPESAELEINETEIEKKYFINYNKLRKTYKNSFFEQYRSIIGGLLSEIEYFPIGYGSADYMFGDGFGSVRNDATKNLGCEITDRENTPGRLPVCSMTGGTVEKVKYSEREGQQIIIKTESGTRYQYSRLMNLQAGIKSGAAIKAGDLLGYMGQGRHSDIPTLTGLYLQISPKQTLTKEEFWINPYVFLRISEQY